MIVTPFLNEISSRNNPLINESFNLIEDYLETLILFELKIIKIYNNQNKDLFSSFVQKKLYNNFFKTFSENPELTNPIEKIETIVKYTQKTIDNTHEFFKFMFSRKNSVSSEKVQNLFFFVVNGYVNVFKELLKIKFDTIRDYISENDANFFKIFHLLNNLNKQLKVYFYDIQQNSNFTDFIFEEMGEKYFKELSLDQKQFSSKFIKDTLTEKLPKPEIKIYDQDEILDMIYLILKDNFKLSYLSKNTEISKFCFEHNALHCLKEILSLFRNSYNKEIESKNFERKTVFYYIEIINKSLIYFDKFYNKISKTIHIETNKTVPIIKDIQKLLDNFVHLVIKDIKKQGVERFISLFSINN